MLNFMAIVYREFFKSFSPFSGVSEEWRDNAHKFLSDGSGMTQEFSADGDNWTITTSTGKGEREFKVTLGQEADSITLDGRPIKVRNIIYPSKLGPMECSVGAQWLGGRVLDSRPRGRGFEPHRRHCVVVLEQDTFILA